LMTNNISFKKSFLNNLLDVDRLWVTTHLKPKVEKLRVST
jgi:hypothetical protein